MYATIIVPAATLLIVAPFAAVGNPWSAGWSYAFLPFWFALLAVPGFLQTWVLVHRGIAPSVAVRTWGMLSVVTASLASILGAIFSAFTVVLHVLSIVCFGLSVQLGVRFYRLGIRR